MCVSVYVCMYVWLCVYVCICVCVFGCVSAIECVIYSGVVWYYYISCNLTYTSVEPRKQHSSTFQTKQDTGTIHTLI